MKDEPNPDTRKKNCTFGQLCDKEKCGFRHRLSFANREKLIVSYKFNKICPSIISTENTNAKISLNKNDIQLKNKSSKNLYLSLDDDDDIDDDDIDDVDDIDDDDDVDDEEIKPKQFIKSWVDVVINFNVNDNVNVNVNDNVNVNVNVNDNVNVNVNDNFNVNVNDNVNDNVNVNVNVNVKSDVKSDVKSKLNLNIESKWEDIGDEDYLMNFDN